VRRPLIVANGELRTAGGRLSRTEIRLVRLELYPERVELWAALKSGREMRLLSAPQGELDVAMLRAAIADQDLRVDLFPALGPDRGTGVPSELHARAQAIERFVPRGVTFIPSRSPLNPLVAFVGLMGSAMIRSGLLVTALGLVALPFAGLGYLASRHLPERDLVPIAIAGLFFWGRFNLFLLRHVQRKLDEQRAKRRDGLYFFPDGCLLVRRGSPRIWIPREQVGEVIRSGPRGAPHLTQIGPNGPREIDVSYLHRERWSELADVFRTWRARRSSVRAGGGSPGT
jgi:hypothetical protein